MYYLKLQICKVNIEWLLFSLLILSLIYMLALFTSHSGLPLLQPNQELMLCTAVLTVSLAQSLLSLYWLPLGLVTN